MTWKGRNPVVNLITKSYEKGVRLTKKAMNKIEEAIHKICDFFLLPGIVRRSPAISKVPGRDDGGTL